MDEVFLKKFIVANSYLQTGETNIDLWHFSKTAMLCHFKCTIYRYTRSTVLHDKFVLQSNSLTFCTHDFAWPVPLYDDLLQHDIGESYLFSEQVFTLFLFFVLNICSQGSLMTMVWSSMSLKKRKSKNILKIHIDDAIDVAWGGVWIGRIEMCAEYYAEIIVSSALMSKVKLR